ncbi:MFS transporter [Lactobacillus sp. ESL0791]|uniref:MFS transporter n=1 Tax=Lactobacillus sp. ESL0791 TaxID=2983234 RepID=UPI0023F8B1E7|nr:MFS transporter [Lactobacillus sp. ESL0791]MDF7639665.1 MFS transporter [Lactobacillus sp. ESL0791]
MNEQKREVKLMNEGKRPPLSSYRWVILGIIALMDMISNYVQFQISALATQIMPALHISQAQFSSLLMAPMLVAVFLSIPSGMLADKFGAKRVVTVGCIVSVIGAYGRLVAHNFISMMLMLMLFGIYMALLNANTIKIFSTWFKQDTNIAMGIFFASASVGITLSQLTSSLFASVNAAYLFSSTVLLVLTVLWIIFVKDTPKGEVVPKGEPVTKYLKIVVKSKKTWLVGISGGIGSAATMSFTGILPQALINGKAIAVASAGAIASVATIGSLIGSLVAPAVTHKLNRAKPFMVLTRIVAAISIFITWFMPAGGLMVTNLVIGGLFGAANGPLMQGMVAEFPEIGSKYAGSAGGLVGTVQLLLSYVVTVAISAIAGQNYLITFAIQAILTASTMVFILLLPDANHVQ